MIKSLLLVLAAECWMTAGQICFKKSADKLQINESSVLRWVIKLLQELWRFPPLWIGGIGMLVGLGFWLAALNSGNLSIVYSLGSMQYIIALAAAHFFLQEKIDAPKLIGTFLITLGIILTVIG